MLIIFGFLVAGFLCGFLLRRIRIRWVGKVTTALVWVLLLFLGIEVGSNRELIKSLPSLGLEAVAVSVAAILGSCLMALALWRWTEGRKHSGRTGGGDNAEAEKEGTVR